MKKIKIKKKQNSQYISHSNSIYEVYLDWKSIENGGPKQTPIQGIYYFTTNIKCEDQNNAWSVAIKLDALHPNQALLWFLVDDPNRQLEVGHMIELLAGNRCVADAMLYSIKPVKDLSFWFEACSECHGQGRMQLCIEEKYLKPFLCCDCCYHSFVVPVIDGKVEYINSLKIPNHFANIHEIQFYGLESYALHIYL